MTSKIFLTSISAVAFAVMAQPSSLPFANSAAYAETDYVTWNSERLQEEFNLMHDQIWQLYDTLNEIRPPVELPPVSGNTDTTNRYLPKYFDDYMYKVTEDHPEQISDKLLEIKETPAYSDLENLQKQHNEATVDYFVFVGDSAKVSVPRTLFKYALYNPFAFSATPALDENGAQVPDALGFDNIDNEDYVATQPVQVPKLVIDANQENEANQANFGTSAYIALTELEGFMKHYRKYKEIVDNAGTPEQVERATQRIKHVIARYKDLHVKDPSSHTGDDLSGDRMNIFWVLAYHKSNLIDYSPAINNKQLTDRREEKKQAEDAAANDYAALTAGHDVSLFKGDTVEGDRVNRAFAEKLDEYFAAEKDAAKNYVDVQLRYLNAFYKQFNDRIDSLKVLLDSTEEADLNNAKFALFGDDLFSNPDKKPWQDLFLDEWKLRTQITQPHTPTGEQYTNLHVFDSYFGKAFDILIKIAEKYREKLNTLYANNESAKAEVAKSINAILDTITALQNEYDSDEFVHYFGILTEDNPFFTDKLLVKLAEIKEKFDDFNFRLTKEEVSRGVSVLKGDQLAEVKEMLIANKSEFEAQVNKLEEIVNRTEKPRPTIKKLIARIYAETLGPFPSSDQGPTTSEVSYYLAKPDSAADADPATKATVHISPLSIANREVTPEAQAAYEEAVYQFLFNDLPEIDSDMTDADVKKWQLAMRYIIALHEQDIKNNDVDPRFTRECIVVNEATGKRVCDEPKRELSLIQKVEASRAALPIVKAIEPLAEFALVNQVWNNLPVQLSDKTFSVTGGANYNYHTNKLDGHIVGAQVDGHYRYADLDVSLTLNYAYSTFKVTDAASWNHHMVSGILGANYFSYFGLNGGVHLGMGAIFSEADGNPNRYTALASGNVGYDLQLSEFVDLGSIEVKILPEVKAFFAATSRMKKKDETEFSKDQIMFHAKVIGGVTISAEDIAINDDFSASVELPIYLGGNLRQNYKALKDSDYGIKFTIRTGLTGGFKYRDFLQVLVGYGFEWDKEIMTHSATLKATFNF